METDWPFRIPISRGQFFALVDEDDFLALSEFAWHRDVGGYARRSLPIVDGKRTGSIAMHRQILNAPAGIEVDHINHVRLDNRRFNLRLATASQNHGNTRSLPGTSSRFKGVTWFKRYSLWRAQVKHQGKGFHIGYFADEEAAARAYDERAIAIWGEFACLNFPESGSGSAA